MVGGGARDLRSGRLAQDRLAPDRDRRFAVRRDGIALRHAGRRRRLRGREPDEARVGRRQLVYRGRSRRGPDPAVGHGPIRRAARGRRGEGSSPGQRPPGPRPGHRGCPRHRPPAGPRTVPDLAQQRFSSAPWPGKIRNRSRACRWSVAWTSSMTGPWARRPLPRAAPLPPAPAGGAQYRTVARDGVGSAPGPATIHKLAARHARLVRLSPTQARLTPASPPFGCRPAGPRTAGHGSSAKRSRPSQPDPQVPVPATDHDQRYPAHSSGLLSP